MEAAAATPLLLIICERGRDSPITRGRDPQLPRGIIDSVVPRTGSPPSQIDICLKDKCGPAVPPGFEV